MNRRIRPFYISGRKGPLFAIYYPPHAGLGARGDLLVSPPFAEEMNRCRAMVAIQAREFSRMGIGTLVLDPYGTGDSAGEFSEGSWEVWLGDLKRGVEWLRAEANGCGTILGIRLGAAMASTLAAQDSDIDRLLLWQPVLDGRSFLTQFLRIRIAAEMEQRAGVKTTDQLRRMAETGEHIEVSGYRLSPALVRELDKVKFAEPERLKGVRLAWCEVLASAESSVSRTSQRGIDACRAAGVPTFVEHVVGPAFWQLHERATAPALIRATNSLIGAPLAADRSAAGSESGSAAPAPGPATIGAADEFPLVFPCAGEDLLGLVHRGRAKTARGLVIVVAGGPQYRAGAHRQFVSLARKLQGIGYAVMRFDLRGMGDSSGDHVGFQQSAADIRAAIDAFTAAQPQLDEIVLFGECESASGIIFYAYQDLRVKGIVLINPWVRTEGGRAEVILKHYYVSRFLSKEFWRKVRAGRFNPAASIGSLIATCRTYLRGRRLHRRSLVDSNQDIAELPLPLRTAAGLGRFKGTALIVLSGHDYIAREFDEVTKSSQAWRNVLANPRVTRRDLPGADHTFSREIWKSQVFDWVCDWMGSW